MKEWRAKPRHLEVQRCNSTFFVPPAANWRRRRLSSSNVSPRCCDRQGRPWVGGGQRATTNPFSRVATTRNPLRLGDIDRSMRIRSAPIAGNGCFEGLVLTAGDLSRQSSQTPGDNPTSTTLCRRSPPAKGVRSF